MMSFDRALKIALNKNPDRRFTGKAFMYDGAYYLELALKNSTGVPIDSMFRVDGTTAKVTTYIPVTDGIIKPWEMKPIKTL